MEKQIEINYWKEYSANRAPEVQNILFEYYRDWAQWIAQRLYNQINIKNLEIQEFEQYAYEGLLHAITKFCYKKNIQFKTFAEYRVRGNILNNLPNTSEKSAHYYKKKHYLNEANISLAKNSENSSPIERLIDMVNELSVQYLLQYEDEDMITYQGELYSSPEFKMMSERLFEMVLRLKEPLKSIINAYYRKGLSFSDISKLLNLSKGRISQLHKEALQELKRIIK